ncbi:MAG: glycoside hydrolase family protein [Mangrovibacterium sp.]
MNKRIVTLFVLSAFFSSCEKPMDMMPRNEELITKASLNLPPLPHQEGKKGLGASKWMNDWSHKLSEFRVYWHYSWAEHLCDLEPDNVEFVPMIWEGTFIDDTVTTYLKRLKNEGKIQYLLGFNEPDGKNQANMTVDQAIAKWPALEAVGLPLGSPAAVNPDNPWMKEFMAKAEANGLRIDFVTVHSYGGTDPVAFLNKIDKVYNLYKKPIWITEFGCGDWTARTVEENRHTPEAVLGFMQTVLPELEKRDYVLRYAWFPAPITKPQLTSSALWDENGSLTPLGQFYKNFRPNPFAGEGKSKVFEHPVIFHDDFECYPRTAALKNYGYTIWEGTGNVIWGDAYQGKQFGQSNALKINYYVRRTFILEAGKTYRLGVATKIQDGAKHVVQVHPKAAYGLSWVDCFNADWQKHSTQFTVTPGNEEVTIAIYRQEQKVLGFDDITLTEVVE